MQKAMLIHTRGGFGEEDQALDHHAAVSKGLNALNTHLRSGWRVVDTKIAGSQNSAHAIVIIEKGGER